MLNPVSTVSNPVSDSINRTFPIYTITPHTTRNDTRNNKPLSVINPNRTRTHAHVRNNHHDPYDLNNHTHRYSLSYLIVCMVMSCFLGLIVMQNYIITHQEITATESGYISTIFGEDYLYR